MIPTILTVRLIHQAFVSRLVRGFATALLSLTLITIGRGQQPSPPQNPSTPPPSQNPQPQPPTPNPNPAAAAPNPAPPTTPAQPPAPAVPFAQPATQAPTPPGNPIALSDAVPQAINQASTFQQAR